jgi:lipopolysaccharide export system permease protein
MFMLFISLIDLFRDLWRYLNYEVPISQILLVSLYYLPKSISFALPVSLLFAAAYTLGDLYARNELTSVFAAGIPFYRFTLPLIAIGVILSFLAFFFEDRVVIPTFRTKNELRRVFLEQNQRDRDSDIVIKAEGGRIVYSVDFYDYQNLILNNVMILAVEEKEDRDVLSVVRAPRATWSGTHWQFYNAVIYEWEDGIMRVNPLADTDVFQEDPETFRRSSVNPEDLSAREAALMVEDLRSAGLPYNNVLADYYHRYSFSAVCLVVMILSISMGGRFRKNILIMSFASSLGASAVFYVTEMLTMMLARMGYIPPIIGAWFPVTLFIILGITLLQSAKT